MRDGDIILLWVADFGEYLSEVAGLVDSHHFLVEGELLADAMVTVDVVVGIVVVFLVVDNSFEGETLAEVGLFVGITHSEGDDWDNARRQLELVGNGLGVVEYCAEIAETESFSFGSDADVLSCKRGIDGARHEPQEVVVRLVAVAEAAPVVVAIDVDADGKKGRSRAALSEMEFGERSNVFGLLGKDDAVNLHVACVGGTHATFENALHLVLFYGTRLEFADAAMVVDEVYSGHCFKIIVSGFRFADIALADFIYVALLRKNK